MGLIYIWRRRRGLLAGATWLAISLPAAAIDTPLHCGGTEPFWAIVFEDEGRAVWSRMDGPTRVYSIPHRAIAEGRPEEPVAMTLIGDQGGTLVAILRRGQCNDGMSDIDFDWSVDLLTQRSGQAILLTGCCRAPSE